jgi:hypothetical protein
VDAPTRDGIVVLSSRASELFDTLNFLFFLNQSDYHAMVLSNMGAVRYASYQPNRYPIFGTRTELHDYLLAAHVVDYAIRLTGSAEDAYSAATEVPIPGRTMRITAAGDSVTASLKQLLLLACVDLLDGGFIEMDRDPLQMLSVMDALPYWLPTPSALLQPLEAELGAMRARLGAAVSWSPFVESLATRDAEVLQPYESRGLDPDHSFEPAAGLSQPPSQLGAQSQEQLHYLRRFRREYAQLYLLRVGIDWLEREKDYVLAITVLRVLLSLGDFARCHAQSKLGGFWLRLSIDLVHVGNKALALQIAWLALQDEQMPLHSQIKLQQRVVFLMGSGQRDSVAFPLLDRLKVSPHFESRRFCCISFYFVAKCRPF